MIKSAVPTFGIGFEFPTSTVANPVVTSKPATGEMATSSPTPPQQRTVPPPPPPVRDVPQSTKLSLKNYAAPSLSPTISPVASRLPLNSPSLSTANLAANPFTMPQMRVTPPVTPAEENGAPFSGLHSGWESNEVTPKAAASGKMQTIIGGQPASTAFEPQLSNLTLHWPWGLTQTPSGPLAPGQRRSSRSESGSGSNSPYSPKVMSPLASPVHSNSGSPQTHSGTASPGGYLDPDASEQLYHAMVKNWCFAQSPGPGPGQTTGFPSSEGFFGGVLVG